MGRESPFLSSTGASVLIIPPFIHQQHPTTTPCELQSLLSSIDNKDQPHPPPEHLTKISDRLPLPGLISIILSRSNNNGGHGTRTGERNSGNYTLGPRQRHPHCCPLRERHDRRERKPWNHDERKRDPKSSSQLTISIWWTCDANKNRVSSSSECRSPMQAGGSSTLTKRLGSLEFREM